MCSHIPRLLGSTLQPSFKIYGTRVHTNQNYCYCLQTQFIFKPFTYYICFHNHNHVHCFAGLTSQFKLMLYCILIRWYDCLYFIHSLLCQTIVVLIILPNIVTNIIRMFGQLQCIRIVVWPNRINRSDRLCQWSIAEPIFKYYLLKLNWGRIILQNNMCACWLDYYASNQLQSINYLNWNTLMIA